MITNYLLPHEHRRMNWWPLLLHLMSLLDSALSSLPAPVNVSVHSVNFHHVLRWDPGPGTPPGAHYRILRLKKTAKQLSNSTATSVKLKLASRQTYLLSVQASYNHSLSPLGPTVSFAPFRDTIIDPPEFSLAGCGTCIQVNVSLPAADRSSGIEDIHEFYNAEYRVLWKKRHGAVELPYSTDKTSFTLNNLQSGTEYCVQVHLKLRLNDNTRPSAWKCAFSSVVEPSAGLLVLGAVAALLIVVISVLMVSIYFLYYIGFICKLKATLPRAALIVALSRGYTLTPERTIPDQICISPDMERLRKHNKAAAPQPATRGAHSEEEDEEEEEEEEEGLNVYMNRATQLSFGESSCQGSGGGSGSRTPAAAGNSGSLTTEAEAPESEVAHEGLDQDEAKTEGAEVSFIPEGGQTEVQGHVTAEEEEQEEEEEVCDSSGDVNLLSVTLAALAECEEEEQNTRDSLTDLLNPSHLEPPPAADSHTGSGDQTAVAWRLTREDCTGTGYTGRRTDTLSGCLETCDGETQHEEAQEEEEEEEFSGYMRHNDRRKSPTEIFTCR